MDISDRLFYNERIVVKIRLRGSIKKSIFLSRNRGLFLFISNYVIENRNLCSW